MSLTRLGTVVVRAETTSLELKQLIHDTLGSAHPLLPPPSLMRLREVPQPKIAATTTMSTKLGKVCPCSVCCHGDVCCHDVPEQWRVISCGR